MPEAGPTKVLYVIAPERFNDAELLVPRRLLEQRGVAVAVASTRPGVAVGVDGAKVAVERSLAETSAGEFDALALAGGAGAPAHLWDSEPVLRLVREFHRAGKPVAAICLSGAVLARAGVLAGRRATVFATPRAIAELRRGGASYVAEPVVEDGNLLTADGPAAAAEFGAALFNLLDRCPTNP